MLYCHDLCKQKHHIYHTINMMSIRALKVFKTEQELQPAFPTCHGLRIAIGYLEMTVLPPCKFIQKLKQLPSERVTASDVNSIFTSRTHFTEKNSGHLCVRENSIVIDKN